MLLSTNSSGRTLLFPVDVLAVNSVLRSYAGETELPEFDPPLETQSSAVLPA